MKNPRFFEIWTAYRYGKWCSISQFRKSRTFTPSEDNTTGCEIWWNYRPAVVISSLTLCETTEHVVLLPITNFFRDGEKCKTPTYFSIFFKGGDNVSEGYIKCDQMNSFALTRECRGGSYLGRKLDSSTAYFYFRKISALVKSYIKGKMFYLFPVNSKETEYRYQVILDKLNIDTTRLLKSDDSLFYLSKYNINLGNNKFKDIYTGAIITTKIKDNDVVCVVLSRVNELGLVTVIQSHKLEHEITEEDNFYYPLPIEETNLEKDITLFLHKIRSIDIEKRETKKIGHLDDSVMDDIIDYIYKFVISLEQHNGS